MKKMIIACCCLLTLVVTISFNSENMTETVPLSYLALGDSYTIGQGVSSNQTWPVLLAGELTKQGHPVEMPKVIARTGWRTDNLINAIGEEDLNEKFDLVSILIGVNNQFQGKDMGVYKKDLRGLFNTA